MPRKVTPSRLVGTSWTEYNWHRLLLFYLVHECAVFAQTIPRYTVVPSWNPQHSKTIPNLNIYHNRIIKPPWYHLWTVSISGGAAIPLSSSIRALQVTSNQRSTRPLIGTYSVSSSKVVVLRTRKYNIGNAKIRPATSKVQVDRKMFMNLESRPWAQSAVCNLDTGKDDLRNPDGIRTPNSRSACRLKRLVWKIRMNNTKQKQRQINTQKPVKWANLAGSLLIAPYHMLVTTLSNE